MPSAAAPDRFSPGEILTLCRECVYPPCRKLAATINLSDRLSADLGYVGNTVAVLAVKTNDAFNLTAPHHFNGVDMSACDTVQEHVAAIARKLARANRLDADLLPPKR